jgi:hypothetical protein
VRSTRHLTGFRNLYIFFITVNQTNSGCWEQTTGDYLKPRPTTPPEIAPFKIPPLNNYP